MSDALQSAAPRKPVQHIRVIAPEDELLYLCKLLQDRLQEFEVLEVTTPRPIYGDPVNKKAYITIR